MVYIVVTRDSLSSANPFCSMTTGKKLTWWVDWQA